MVAKLHLSPVQTFKPFTTTLFDTLKEKGHRTTCLSGAPPERSGGAGADVQAQVRLELFSKRKRQEPTFVACKLLEARGASRVT